jgi:hypothetical protein
VYRWTRRTMRSESDKIMFEVYREPGFNRQYRVVYFTELEEHDRDAAINAALAGERFYDGFINAADSVAAKQMLDTFLDRLNNGASVSASATSDELEALLTPFLMS